MRWLINYFRSCFCKHDWELIFDVKVGPSLGYAKVHDTHRIKTYRCTKCGWSRQYKSNV